MSFLFVYNELYQHLIQQYKAKSEAQDKVCGKILTIFLLGHPSTVQFPANWKLNEFKNVVVSIFCYFLFPPDLLSST